MPSAVIDLQAACSAVLQALGELPAAQRASVVAAFVVVGAVAAEVAWLAFRDRCDRLLREARVAAVMAAGSFFVAGAAYTVLLSGLWELYGGAAPRFAVELFAAHPVAGFVVAFVAWDASGFVYHLIGHRTRVGWAAHRPHHTGTAYNLSLGLRQSWMPWHGLVHHPLLALAGIPFPMIVASAAVSNLLQALQHTAAEIRWPGVVRAVFMTPEQHRHHHARGSEGVNLGPVLTVWDRLAGTYRDGPVAAGTRYGISTDEPAGALGCELDGWIALIGGRASATAT